MKRRFFFLFVAGVFCLAGCAGTPLVEDGIIVPLFERNKDHARMNYADVRVSLAWMKNGLNGFGHGVDLYFSPLPYLSLGIGVLEVDQFFKDDELDTPSFNDDDICKKDHGINVGFIPLRAGALFPVTEKLTLVSYGTLSWLGVFQNEHWLIGSSPFGIIPGIKTGLLYNFDNGVGLSVGYKGQWIKDGYINSVEMSFWYGRKD
jgi:hypothetical protein